MGMTVPLVPGPSTHRLTAGLPAERVADVIITARGGAGLPAYRLAGAVGVSRGTVRRWERGDAVPSDDEMRRIAQVCGRAVYELFPGRASLSLDRVNQLLRLGTDATALDDLGNRSVLVGYIHLVRLQRGLWPGDPLQWRERDLEMLAGVLDLGDVELDQILLSTLGLAWGEALEMRRSLTRLNTARILPEPVG